jgi:hypothetical protein
MTRPLRDRGSPVRVGPDHPNNIRTTNHFRPEPIVSIEPERIEQE